MAAEADSPGFGDPSAPIGSAQWAEAWRLSMQRMTHDLPSLPGACKRIYELGVAHRAWTLIKGPKGRLFTTFDEFCACPEPFGLEMDPEKFKSYLVTEIGKNATDMATNPPPGSPGRNREEENPVSDTGFSRVDNGPRKQENLRAILRAPEIVQELYRQDLVSQGAAKLMGPAKPDAEKAVQVVEARQAIEAIPKPTDIFDRKRYRQEVDSTIREIMKCKSPSPLEQAKKLLRKLTDAQRVEIVQWLDAGMPSQPSQE